MVAHSKLQTPAFSWISGFEIQHSGVIKSKCRDIEDITWPCGDMKLYCNWVIMLVTMATPISSHVKDKSSIFTVRGAQ